MVLVGPLQHVVGYPRQEHPNTRVKIACTVPPPLAHAERSTVGSLSLCEVELEHCPDEEGF